MDYETPDYIAPSDDSQMNTPARNQLRTDVAGRRYWLAALAAFAVLAASTTPGVGQEAGVSPVYDIELIVFRNLESSATQENWRLEEQATVLDTVQPSADGEEVATPATGVIAAPVDRQVLTRDRYKLTAIAASLQRSRAYRQIAHFGWSQVGSPLNGATPLPIAEFLPAGTVAFTGNAALARGRYLHLTLDFNYTPEGQAQRYVLKQTRRMRSNEQHYFDHPQFGVIALVTPRTP